MPDTGQEIVRGKAPVSAGGKVAAIIPQSFDEAYRLAQVLAASGMTPKDINTPEKVMVAIMAGAEIGMAPFQAVQSFAIINGRPTLWGDGMIGVVRARGVKVEEKIDGAGDDMIAICHVTRPDTNELVSRAFSVSDAKVAGLWKKQGPWTTYPKRMLQMRARAWALRDGCADMLRGIHMAEEAQDVEVIANEPVFIKGAEKDALIEDYTARMRACTELDDITDIMAEAEEKRGQLSSNAWDGLEEIAARESERIEAGVAPIEQPPSPFDELKEQGLACVQAETLALAQAAYAKFLSRANSRTLLALCNPSERDEIKTLKKTIKAGIDSRFTNSAGPASQPPAEEGALVSTLTTAGAGRSGSGAPSLFSGSEK
jgi:hypothetical protein